MRANGRRAAACRALIELVGFRPLTKAPLELSVFAMFQRKHLSTFVLLLGLATQDSLAEPLRALIVDGQNNHNWEATTPVLIEALELEGLFEVDVATSPAKGEDLSDFHPNFSDYDVVVSNYNGELWGEACREDFEDYVASGGGFVSVHAADNAFPEWDAYNEMIGIGGWGGRDEASGPYLYWARRAVKDPSPGRGGNHGRQHAFVVRSRATTHPVVRGLPTEWMHAKDELYDMLRGPAKNVTILATAFADPETGGTGRDEPMLMAIDYGRGRVFHTVLGHSARAMRCAGFQVTLRRGAEWAATGGVSAANDAPDDFPTPNEVSIRE